MAECPYSESSPEVGLEQLKLSFSYRQKEKKKFNFYVLKLFRVSIQGIWSFYSRMNVKHLRLLEKVSLCKKQTRSYK